MLIDGADHPVYAQLEGHIEGHTVESFGGKSRAEGLPVWGGTLQTHGQDLTWAISNAEELILRAEDGREGPFTVTNEDRQKGVLRISGNGAAPFDI